MKQKPSKQETYPEGHFVGMWIGIGIAIFSGFGIAISTATGNPGLIGIGPAIGVAIGVAIGTGVEKKMKKQGKIMPLTKKEKQAKSKVVLIGVLLLVIAMIVFVALLFLR